jgi:hypothetical protein
MQPAQMRLLACMQRRGFKVKNGIMKLVKLPSARVPSAIKDLVKLPSFKPARNGIDVKCNRFFKTVMADVWAKDKELRNKAADYMVAKVKDKISKIGRSDPGMPPGIHTGNLLKGICRMSRKTVSLVGFRKPALHAHLLEFGTTGRMVKNSKGRAGVEESSGEMKARPFFFQTFAEEAGAVKKILSEEWV